MRRAVETFVREHVLHVLALCGAREQTWIPVNERYAENLFGECKERFTRRARYVKIDA